MKAEISHGTETEIAPINKKCNTHEIRELDANIIISHRRALFIYLFIFGGGGGGGGVIGAQ